jgi:hypothetical protein
VGPKTVHEEDKTVFFVKKKVADISSSLRSGMTQHFFDWPFQTKLTLYPRSSVRVTPTSDAAWLPGLWWPPYPISGFKLISRGFGGSGGGSPRLALPAETARFGAETVDTLEDQRLEAGSCRL